MEVSFKITITQDIVNSFAEVSGDKNPIHLDEDYAKETKFGKKIVHGMLLGSFFSKLIAKEYPGPGSVYISQNMQFVHPVYVEDTVTVIVKENYRHKNRYHLLTEVLNSLGEKVIIGTAEVIKP